MRVLGAEASLVDVADEKVGAAGVAAFPDFPQELLQGALGFLPTSAQVVGSATERTWPSCGYSGAAGRGRSVEADDDEVEVLEGGLLGGNVAAGFDRAADLALSDSIALVVQIGVRISRSDRRKGTNSARALSRSLTMAGYFASQMPLSAVAGLAAALSSRGRTTARSWH